MWVKSELLVTKSSIDTHRQKEVLELGMELHWNESKTAESIKEARAICAHVTTNTEALCSSTVKEAKATCVHTVKEAKATHAHTIWKAETACSMAIRDAETQGPPRLSHSRGDMPKPSKTWRNKSSERKIGVRLTFSLLLKLPYTPALQS